MSDMQESRERETLIRELGILGIKVAITLNSGASFAVLALAAAIISKKDVLPNAVDEIIPISLILFLIGILFALVGIAITYIFSQVNRREVNSKFFMLIMLVPTGTSYVCFLGGFANLIRIFY